MNGTEQIVYFNPDLYTFLDINSNMYTYLDIYRLAYKTYSYVRLYIYYTLKITIKRKQIISNKDVVNAPIKTK